MTRLLPLLVAALTALPHGAPSGTPPGARCSVRYPDGSHWRPSAEHATRVALDADVVVRARAARTDSMEAGGRRHPAVVLEVLEVLASRPGIPGDSVPAALTVYGWLTEADDFNPQPVPYGAVRPEGLRGSCHAEGYRRGGEFLLLLRVRHGELTPYWYPLAPTNEQIRGRDDPWVTWVLAERRRAGR